MDKSEPGFFAEMNVAILGLGLMGGSLAMALKGRCASLSGIDPDPAAVKLALEKRVVDQAAGQPSRLLASADLIILAAPVRAIISQLDQIPHHHPSRAVVIDLGSTKAEILAGMESLPERFDPIGGHPICGKEKPSLAFADGDLFQGSVFVFTPLPRTSHRAKETAVQLALAAGARPVWMDAGTHDRMLAATSHFPYLLSNLLAAITPADAAPLVGPGFQSMTRLASSSREMMRDILMTNKSNILSALRDYQERLSLVESLLKADDFETLTALLEDGASRKEELCAPTGEGL